jgi:hypothetical protein
MLKLDDDQMGQREPDEGLAVAGAANRAEQVVGVKPGSRNRRIPDPAGQAAIKRLSLPLPLLPP